MSTLKEDLTAIKEIQDGLVGNKVARFSYTQNAYNANTVDGVNEYNVNNEQNVPNGTASIMKVNSTVLDKGYRAQASSITRMLMNHFLGRISYNLNKINDNMQSLLNTLITKFPTSLPANGGNADTATRLQTARTINIQDSTATNTGTGASFDGSKNATIKLPATIKADIVGHATTADHAISADNTDTARFADVANMVGHSLTFGSKIYNGSSAQTIEASDLGISTVSFSQFCPDLSRIQTIKLLDCNNYRPPFTVPEDGWVLSITELSHNNYRIVILEIDGVTKDCFPTSAQPWNIQAGDDCRYCPFPVKKNQILSISKDVGYVDVTIQYAPCIGN